VTAPGPVHLPLPKKLRPGGYDVDNLTAWGVPPVLHPPVSPPSGDKTFIEKLFKRDGKGQIKIGRAPPSHVQKAAEGGGTNQDKSLWCP